MREQFSARISEPRFPRGFVLFKEVVRDQQDSTGVLAPFYRVF